MKHFYNHFLFFSIFCFYFILNTGSSADAIPSFARKTQMSCMACHSPAYPRLNAMGWAFKENGYQMPGSDDSFQENVATEIDESLELLKDLPLSFRLRGSIKVSPQSSVQADFRLPDELELIAGGRLYKDISFYYMQGLGSAISGTGTPNKGFIQLNNLVQPSLFNIRAGKFGLLDWHLDGHRRLTDAPYLISMSRISHDLPVTMGSNQVGLELYGRPMDGPIFYHLGIFNGNSGGGYGKTDSNTGFFDNNNFKDLSAGLNFRLDTHRFGVFGYYGRYPIQNNLPMPSTSSGLKVAGFNIADVGHDEETSSTTSASITSSTTDTDFYSTGLTMNMQFDPFQVTGMYAFGQNTVSRSLLHGGFLEANYALPLPKMGQFSPVLIGITRGDFVSNISETGTRIRATVTPALELLLLSNVSLLAEYKVDLTNMNQSLGSIKIESIF